jgi:hypothetical protein
MSGRRMTVTTGWGQGKRVTFIDFAQGPGGLQFENVGPTRTVVSAAPGESDVQVKLDGEVLACWYRNLNPMPCRVVLVDAKHADEAAMQKATKRPLADLGVQFLPHGDYRKLLKAFETLCAPCGAFAWHHLPHKSCTVVLGVTRRV